MEKIDENQTTFPASHGDILRARGIDVEAFIAKAVSMSPEEAANFIETLFELSERLLEVEKKTLDLMKRVSELDKRTGKVTTPILRSREPSEAGSDDSLTSQTGRKLQVDYTEFVTDVEEHRTLEVHLQVARKPGKPLGTHWEKRARDDPVKVLMSKWIGGELTLDRMSFVRLVSYCTQVGPCSIVLNAHPLIPADHPVWEQVAEKLQLATLELGLNIM